jgi:integrase
VGRNVHLFDGMPFGDSNPMRALNKLSARKVEKLNEVGRYGDGGGLYLQVSAVSDHVTKAWLFRYMLDGRARAMGLGSVDTFALAEARERARAARQLVADGIDPIERRLQERDTRRAEESTRITFKEAAEKFLKVHESGWRNKKHRSQWHSTLETYVYKKLGARPVSAIDTAVINETVAPIWTTKTETARRTRQRIERIVQWIKEGSPLPAAGKSKRVRHHPALPYSDIPQFMGDLRQREGISARALEFLVLTASRTGAVIGARWPEIDMATKVWTVPEIREGTKLIAKDHRVPLSDRAIEILKSLPRERGNDHVFPGAVKGAGLSNMAMLELMKGMAYPSTTPGKISVPHGFRSTFKDWAAERTNYANIVSEAALAHKISDKVEAAYRRGDLFEKRRRLMNDWARYCARPAAQAANVTAINARA